jgi:thioredoxin-related protein
MNTLMGRRMLLALAMVLGAWRVAFAQDSISWRENLAEAQAEAAKEHKPLVVVFVAGWCSACAAFERNTLPSPLVTAHANRFVWVKLDVERNISLVRVNEVRATPRIDLRDSDGKTWIRISGALPARQFREQLDLFLSAREGKASSVAQEVDGSSYTPLSATPEGFRGGAICYSNVGYGPLRLASQSPFQSLRIGLTPLTPSTLAEGQWEVHLSNAYSNVFIKKPGDYLLQFDLMQTSASIGYGVTDDLEVDLQFDDRTRFGGVLDQFIQHFHHAFGLPNQLRDTEPLNAFHIQFPASQSHPAVDLGNRWRGSYSDTLSAALRQNLTCGTEEIPAVAVGLIARTAVREEDLEHEEWVNPGLTLSAAKRVGDFYFYASGLVAYYGHDRFHGIPLQPVQVSGILAVEWRFDDWASMIFQWQISEGVARTVGQFASAANELALGWKIEFVRNAIVEFGAIHTLLNNENSMDFGLYAGLTVRF